MEVTVQKFKRLYKLAWNVKGNETYIEKDIKNKVFRIKNNNKIKKDY